ncbi:MAG: NADH-quinone oxidoreductase subunit J family protein [Actinomycetota bacterium]
MAETYQEVIFWVFAAFMAVTGIRVVTTRNVVHAALYLVGTLLGASSIYILLYAEFVAWVQVLVYVGAVVVLMLFGLMLTRAPIGSANFDNNQRLVAALCAGLVFVVTSLIMIQAFEGQEIDLTATEGTRVESIGEVIFSIYVLPFEIVSVLLLAALVGAVVISRRDEGPVDS